MKSEIGSGLCHSKLVVIFVSNSSRTDQISKMSYLTVQRSILWLNSLKLGKLNGFRHKCNIFIVPCGREMTPPVRKA